MSSIKYRKKKEKYRFFSRIINCCFVCIHRVINKKKHIDTNFSIEYITTITIQIN